MTSLLLLVDLQNDYLAAPDLEPAPGEVVRRASALLEGCRGLGMGVAHVLTTVSRDDDRRMPHWKRQSRWICEEGTHGHAPPPGLEPHQHEAVVHKTSFGAFAGGQVDRLLRERAVDRLLVAGVHLHGCVRQTVLEAYERDGIEIWVVEDATGSDDPVHAAITRRYLERRAARFVRVAEALAELGAKSNGRPARLDVEAAAGSAAQRAGQALGAWQVTSAEERRLLLRRLAEGLEREADDMAAQMAVQLGKPVRYGAAEVRSAARLLRAVGEHALTAGGEERAGTADLRHRPLGTVAVVTPWNNPIYISLGKIAPAIAYGNAVLWKPAPAAQAIAAQLLQRLDEAGLPEGLVGLVAGGRREAEALMSHPRVDAVTLTGSSAAGYAAQEVCARRRVPLQAELGGNNAALVWHDADLAEAAAQIADGAFAQAGQRCTANRRVVVHQSCREQLLELLRREIAALTWGDPLAPDTRVGPLVSDEACERVADAVARAGPVVVPHAERPSGAGSWYPPTIVFGEDPAHEIVQHETFGPVLVVQSAHSWDHALSLVNGVRQGLVASVFSASAEVAARFLDEAEAGILKVNRSTADADVDVPFGGWKASGIGPPEHGHFDRDFYTRPQVVYGARP